MIQIKVLVPIDFSGCSIKALEVAAKLAKKINAKLIILNACEKSVAYVDTSATAYSRDLRKEAESNAKSSFESIEKSIEALQEVEHTFTVIHAFAKEAILSLALKEDIELIVMGTTGASGIKGVLFGSNTHAIVKNVVCPVMIIPEEAETGKFFKNIALAGDYQHTASKETFELLIYLAKSLNAQIHVLHVSEIPVIKAGESEEAQKLDRYFKNIQHSFHFKLDSNVDEGLDEYVEDNGIDLLTLVAKKHRLLDRIFKESITKKMTNHSKVPLLILHAK